MSGLVLISSSRNRSRLPLDRNSHCLIRGSYRFGQATPTAPFQRSPNNPIAKLMKSTCFFAKAANYKGPIMTISQDISGRYLCTKEAARVLSLSFRTLEKYRVYGTGPQFMKLGGRVVYKIEDLHSWASRGSRRSTSDEGQGISCRQKGTTPV